MQVTGGTVEIHADGGTVPIVGVFNGCQYTDPTTGEQVLVTIIQPSTNASDIIAFIVDDPMVVFEVQANAIFQLQTCLVTLILFTQQQAFNCYWYFWCRIECS